MTDEEEIMRRALRGPATKGYQRKIPFFTTEQLLDDLTRLYPTVNQISIYNHDLRDTEGGPVLTVRKHRDFKAVITTTRYGTGSVTTDFHAKWQLCFVAVENGTAFIKVSNLTVGAA